jgi:hypothetical protein
MEQKITKVIVPGDILLGRYKVLQDIHWRVRAWINSEPKTDLMNLGSVLPLSCISVFGYLERSNRRTEMF